MAVYKGPFVVVIRGKCHYEQFGCNFIDPEGR